MPPTVTDPKLLARLDHQSQILELLAANISKLDERQKHLEDNVCRTVSALDRRWQRISDAIESRDTALAQFEAIAIQQLGEILGRLPPEDGPTLLELQSAVTELTDTFRHAHANYASLVRNQKEEFHRLRASLVDEGIAEHGTAYNTTLEERTAGENTN